MHRTTDRFWECFENLPEHIQKISKKNFELLKTNPSHPSLHFRKVGKFWSVRVGINHRALAFKESLDVCDGFFEDLYKKGFGVVRGKYYKRLLDEGANVVMLEPDVAKAFVDSASVNDALRSLLDLTKTTQCLTKHPSGRTIVRR